MIFAKSCEILIRYKNNFYILLIQRHAFVYIFDTPSLKKGKIHLNRRYHASIISLSLCELILKYRSYHAKKKKKKKKLALE
jgi:hypothetical protein